MMNINTPILVIASTTILDDRVGAGEDIKLKLKNVDEDQVQKGGDQEAPRVSSVIWLPP